jgi:hypothetical protein
VAGMVTAQSDQNGVGGITRTLYYRAGTGHTAAQVVSGGAVLPADRAALESDVSNAYTMAVRICDALGNCRNELIGSFGVDVTPPTLAILTGSPANMAINPTAGYQFSVSDTRSGPAAQQLRVQLVRNAPGLTAAQRCPIGWNATTETCGFENMNGPIDPTAQMAGEGYYTLTVQGRDAAGNVSGETVTRLALRDVTAPTVSNVAIPASLVGGQAATFTAVATDNLDLGRYSFRLEYANGFELPVQADQPLGSFGEESTVREATLSSTVNFVRAIEMATGGTPDGAFHLATAARFRVWDVANNTATQANAFAVGTVTRPGTAIASFSALGVQVFEMNTSPATIWTNPTGTQVGSTTLRARAVGPSGTFGNPFTRVTFYRTIGGIHFPIGDATAAATDTGTERIWTYSGASVAAGTTAGTREYFAVGYTAQGDALVSDPQTITISTN